MHKILANTHFLGKEIINLTVCQSTNDEAIRLFKTGNAKEGTVVVTEAQTRGKGQRGNRWYSEPGKNLTFSLVLTPLFLDATEQFDLNMAIAVGVQEVLTGYVAGTEIKWPNDFVHITQGKLGGMLIENIVSGQGIEMSVVGLGLNINQTDFPFPTATSVANIAGSAVYKDEFFRLLITSIEKYYILLKKGERKEIRQAYLRQLFRLGKWSSYVDKEFFTGRILGVSNFGKLLMEKQNGETASYSFKEVAFL
jgi:BirA family transcriptional regulator, biotin operon repressor / biotin---[acetyl-CoA-carboxylase] ligase